jgi:hypothetical protein
MTGPMSLVFGTAELAGVLSTCMRVFDLHEQSRQHGTDFSLVLAKLDLEKTNSCWT